MGSHERIVNDESNADGVGKLTRATSFREFSGGKLRESRVTGLRRLYENTTDKRANE